MPEMSDLQVGPLGLHDDNGDGITGTTLLLHAETCSQGLRTTGHHTHTHKHARKLVYVQISLQRGVEGLDEPLTGVE